MKIAVPVTKMDQVDNHFGHCESYQVFTVSEENKIVVIQSLPSPTGCGCKSDIAQTLASQGVSVMLAGGIGNGAIHVLGNSGIKVVRGCSGNVAKVVSQYVAGSIADNGLSCQNHDHDHVCSH